LGTVACSNLFELKEESDKDVLEQKMVEYTMPVQDLNIDQLMKQNQT